MALVVFGVIVYPVGVLVSFGCVVWAVRHKKYDKRNRRMLGVLYALCTCGLPLNACALDATFSRRDVCVGVSCSSRPPDKPELHGFVPPPPFHATVQQRCDRAPEADMAAAPPFAPLCVGQVGARVHVQAPAARASEWPGAAVTRWLQVCR